MEISYLQSKLKSVAGLHQKHQSFPPGKRYLQTQPHLPPSWKYTGKIKVFEYINLPGIISLVSKRAHFVSQRAAARAGEKINYSVNNIASFKSLFAKLSNVFLSLHLILIIISA